MKVKQWIKIAVFCVLSILILLFASELLCVANEKDAVGVYGFFKEPEDSIDVVMIGASSMYSYFYSPQAYAEQGFTSYSLASSTMTAPLYRYAAEMAIETQHPQLLVFETWSFCYDVQVDETSFRKFLDACPNSDIKRRAIAEIVPEELRSSFTWPFQKYHSSWPRVGDCIDVLQDKMFMNSKGYSITKNFATTPVCMEYRPQNGVYNISDEGFKYLEILLDYLKEADIENVLFVRYPEMISYEPQESYGKMIEMIREAGFDFVNLNAAAEDIGIDRNHDFYNSTHLNVFGAEKFTSFLSGYIMHQYDIDITHDAAVTAEWEECASYNDQILSRLERLTEEGANGYLYTQSDFLEQ